MNSPKEILINNSSIEAFIYIDEPTDFQLKHIQQIAPFFSTRLLSTILILQRAQVNLQQNSQQVKKEKDRLFDIYQQFCVQLRQEAEQNQIELEPINPKTGKPLLSQDGVTTHDDVEAALAILQKINPQNHKKQVNGCKIIHHYKWGTNNYPSFIFCGANPTSIELLLNNL